MAEPKDEGEGALSRWSRLKSESRAAPAPAEPDTPADAQVPEAPGEDAPVRVEDLPDVETLTFESDFTQFMREGVPAALQRLALHKLWRSDPVLANLDGLNDYDLDYRDLGADTRVTEALLEQRQARDRLLGGATRPAAPEPGGGTAPTSPQAAPEEPAGAAAEADDGEPEQPA